MEAQKNEIKAETRKKSGIVDFKEEENLASKI
jgi:hypothetical protein